MIDRKKIREQLHHALDAVGEHWIDLGPGEDQIFVRTEYGRNYEGKIITLSEVSLKIVVEGPYVNSGMRSLDIDEIISGDVALLDTLIGPEPDEEE